MDPDPIGLEPYRAPWWLPGGNAQTVYAALVARRERIELERERWSTPDDDFVVVDRLRGPDRSPFIVLFHGLEGGADSHYAEALMAALGRAGWRGAIPHFRSCGGEVNRLPRAYHSGDWDEIDWMLARFRADLGDAPLFAVGVSLGGNALLKWLAEKRRDARRVVEAAAAISAPLDLSAAADAIERGFAMVYTRMFLRSLKAKISEKAREHPGVFDLARIRGTRTLREFDDLVTAPLHGFRDAADYYARASAKPVLGEIEVPTLVVNARNDPFLPGGFLPRADEVSTAVTLDFPEAGGHVGFVSGPFPGNLAWLPNRIIEFFSRNLENRRGEPGA